MPNKHSKESADSTAPLNRRTALKTLGIGATALLGGTTSALASPKRARVVRLKGNYNNPISYEEAQDALASAVGKRQTKDLSIGADEAVPEYEKEHEIVDYTARVGPDGRVTQFYGASSAEKESVAHAATDRKVAEFEGTQLTKSQSAPTVNASPEWNYVTDDQAYLVDHWGELNHNFEWYRVRDGSSERNAFRSLIASTDGTINPYERKVYAKHDWGVSELGNEALHNAGPSTTGAGSVTVGLGYPPSATLSWTVDLDGQVTQNLTNNGPVVDWKYNIPNNGTSWFYPGSHVTATRSQCNNKQKVAKLKAVTDWGYVYKSTHRWNINTTTC
jgi:hypothetical protein